MKNKREWTPFVECTLTHIFGRVATDAEKLQAKGLIFKNSIYTVTKRKMECDDIIGWWLSIKANDGSARHDWREFQRIKNELVGAEAEGVEIYPAESRLVDTANQFHLFCFEGFKFPFGFSDRLVSEESAEGGSQRKWRDDSRPKDLAENIEQRAKELLEQKGL